MYTGMLVYILLWACHDQTGQLQHHFTNVSPLSHGSALPSKRKVVSWLPVVSGLAGLVHLHGVQRAHAAVLFQSHTVSKEVFSRRL